jgi:hypothetical protein
MDIELPADYLVLDIETDSTIIPSGNILQIGYLQCFDNEIRHAGGVYLQTPEDTLLTYEHGSYVAKQQRLGKGYVKADDVRRLGIPRDQALPLLRALVEATARLPGMMFVGHNMARFDVPFIEHFCNKMGFPFRFPRERIIDTGAFYKSTVMKPRAQFAEGEQLWEFSLRIANSVTPGVFWALETACQELELDKKHQLDLSKAHTANADALMTHFLYQELRHMLKAA